MRPRPQATAPGLCTLPPTFGGLEQAVSASFPTCRIDLTWNGAVPECGGPVSYNLYRSTGDGFTPGAENLLVSGLTGTSATDVNDLQDGTIYSYIVHAVDQASGAEDGNLVERSVVAAGAGAGMQTFLDEDFESPSSFDAWTVQIGPGLHTCGEWELSATEAERPSDGNGSYALSRSQGCLTSTSLDSPTMDLGLVDAEWVFLQAAVHYGYANSANATIEVWDGAAWHTRWSDPNETVNCTLYFDVTPFAVGNPAFQVRFNYQFAANDLLYAVDNVLVTADVISSCSPSGGVPPVPDGSAGTQGLLARRVDVAGNTIELEWDAASCPASGYNVLHGSLGDVATHELAGGVCSVDPGSFTWTGVPSGDLYFLVVGANGVDTESSWGLGTAGERNGLGASGQCGATIKDVSTSCP